MSSGSLGDATVAIIGLGLMGGSLGRALDGACARRLGADRDRGRASSAVAAGAIDASMSVEECAASADLVVLAMPVRQVIAHVPQIAAAMRPGSVVTDLGSTKRLVCDVFDELPAHIGAIGGHPMCGRASSGIDAADSALFRGAIWALVHTQRTTCAAHALATELAHVVGAAPLDVDRVAHDHAVATASHAPYVVAQALVSALRTADERTSGVASQLAATGFAGATRLAAGDVEMWVDILLTNSGDVRDAIDDVRSELARISKLLQDPDGLERALASGRTRVATAATSGPGPGCMADSRMLH